MAADNNQDGFDFSGDPSGNARVLHLIVQASRAGVIFGIGGTLLAAFVLFFYGSLTIAHEFWIIVSDDWPNLTGAKSLAVVAVEVTDLFLLGTVLNIVALGLFQLFMDPTIAERLPTWMQVTSLDQLKSKLIGVVVVLLGVSFLSKVVQKTIPDDILELGLAIGVVIIALGFISISFDRKSDKNGAATD